MSKKNLSIYLYNYLSIYDLSIYLSIHQFIYIYIYLFDFRDNEVEVVVSSIKSLSILLNSIQVQDKLYKVSETVIDALKRHPDKSSIVHALVRSLLPVIAISSENGPAFYDHIKLLLDAFPANCFMTKLSFLVEVLPLMAFTLTKHSPSSQPTIRDKPEESSNSTIRYSPYHNSQPKSNECVCTGFRQGIVNRGVKSYFCQPPPPPSGEEVKNRKSEKIIKNL